MIHSLLILAGAAPALSAGAAAAAPIYLNIDTIAVALGPGVSEAALNNTLTLGRGIEKAIDAPSADALETHDQETHVWFTAPTPGAALELRFDFGAAYDILAVHFWNYTEEEHDVDEIAFDFHDGDGVFLDRMTVAPAFGSHPGIAAQTIPLRAPLNVRYVTARLSGSNGEVDFQNIGFTAELSEPVPAPGRLRRD